MSGRVMAAIEGYNMANDMGSLAASDSGGSSSSITIAGGSGDSSSSITIAGDRDESDWEDALESISHIKDICKVPSISIGVLHLGRPVLSKSIGYRDVDDAKDATPNTSYLLASCSKMFLSASVAILVDEGKMEWEAPISKYLPTFCPSRDPEIGRNATIVDALSHRTGLGKPQILVWGPYRTVVGKEDDFIQMMNECTTSDDDGRRFGRCWHYNNFPYGMIALAIEAVTEQRYSTFLKEQILNPLGLHETIVSEEDLAAAEDVALPYIQRENGTFVWLSREEYTSSKHMPTLAAVGIQSSVHDMLIFCKAVMEAYQLEQENIPVTLTKNPLRCVKDIFCVRWTRPTEDGFDNEAAYCMGWYRAFLPTAAFGLLSHNYRVLWEDPEYSAKHIIGRASPRRLFFGANGLMSGASSAIYIFPETNSAVVAFANGFNDGDAPDFAAKVLTQELFRLEPRVDLLPLARREAAADRQWYHNLLVDWLKNRNVYAPDAPLNDFIGSYSGLCTTIVIAYSENRKHLVFTLNERKDSTCRLEFYNKDTFSFQPTTRDEWLEGSFVDWDYYKSGLFFFHRDQQGHIDGLHWQYDEYEHPTWFQRRSSSLSHSVYLPGSLDQKVDFVDI